MEADVNIFLVVHFAVRFFFWVGRPEGSHSLQGCIPLRGAFSGSRVVTLAWEDVSVCLAVLLVLRVVNEPPRPRVLQHRAQQRQFVLFSTLNLVRNVDGLCRELAVHLVYTPRPSRALVVVVNCRTEPCTRHEQKNKKKRAAIQRLSECARLLHVTQAKRDSNSVKASAHAQTQTLSDSISDRVRGTDTVGGWRQAMGSSFSFNTIL
jgi:hypothetical protein